MANLAAGKPARATSWFPGHEPALATDTDLNTGWMPNPGAGWRTSSIYVDLGQTYEVSEVRLFWGDSYPTQYRIYVWTFVWSGWYGYWAWWPVFDGTSMGGQDTATFNPISTRYVRLSAPTGQGFELREFEVYSSPQGPMDGQPTAGYLTPEVSKEDAGGALRDLVPPGWEDSPAWHQAPSKEDVPLPESLPLEAVPSVDR